MLKRIQHLASGAHEPATVRIISAERRHYQPATAGISVAASATEAIAALPTMSAGWRSAPLLVVAARHPAPAPLRRLIARLAPTTLAVPPGTSGNTQSEHARHSGQTARRLGDRGWVRVNLDSYGSRLPHVDVPSELIDAERVVIFAGEIGTSVLKTWRLLVHPNSRLRSAPLGARGDAELSLAREVVYVFTARLPRGHAAVCTADRIAAELTADGLRRAAEVAQGTEAEGPWEATHIQYLTSLDAGLRLGRDLALHAVAADNHSRQAIFRLSELIGCTVEWQKGA
jgi:hypothetical protein